MAEKKKFIKEVHRSIQVGDLQMASYPYLQIEENELYFITNLNKESFKKNIDIFLADPHIVITNEARCENGFLIDNYVAIYYNKSVRIFEVLEKFVELFWAVTRLVFGEPLPFLLVKNP